MLTQKVDDPSAGVDVLTQTYRHRRHGRVRLDHCAVNPAVQQIEDRLEQHTSMTAAAVIAVPDYVLGEDSAENYDPLSGALATEDVHRVCADPRVGAYRRWRVLETSTGLPPDELDSICYRRLWVASRDELDLWFEPSA